MQSFFPSFILAYHGCDKSIGERVLLGEAKLDHSKNDYDWLGSGVYFWEGNPSRALEYARFLKAHPQKGKPPIQDPFVVGAVIDLGNCLNLVEHEYLKVVQEGYNMLVASSEKRASPLPKNSSPKGETHDLLLRRLDCAVIETIHAFYMSAKKPPFDTARGVFVEGKPLYQNSGFHGKTHIQVCVRKDSCIKGYFRPAMPA